MDVLPSEIKLEFCKYLRIESILILCRTSKNFVSICRNPYIWKFLLKRDYNVDFEGFDPRIEYIIEHTKGRIQTKSLFIVRDLDSTASLFTVLVKDRNEFYQLITDRYNQGKLDEFILGSLIRSHRKSDDTILLTVEDLRN